MQAFYRTPGEGRRGPRQNPRPWGSSPSPAPPPCP